MAGPGFVLNRIENIKPRIADINPMIAEMTKTCLSLFDNNKAVEAGVISIATTRITPTLCKAETTAMDNKSIRNENQLVLTKAGIEKANELVRAHRLWETYQVKQMGLSQEQIHEEAEDLEHFLTDDILFQVDQKLGFPTTDPHGSPIPPTQLKRSNLFAAEVNVTVMISSSQLNDKVESELWELGLMPKSEIKVMSKTEKQIEIQFNKQSIFIDGSLAQEIQIQI